MIEKPSKDDWFIQAPTPRIGRLEAYFSGHAYDPHRHDTYAIGVTLMGVQSFHYRGAHLSSLPGRVIVLHPDEVHDGHAGSEGGFRYRMLYVPPALIQDILGGRPLPFIPGGITTDRGLAAAVTRLLRHLEDSPEPLEEDDGLFDLTTALCRAAGSRMDRRRVDYPATRRAREFIDSAAGQSITLGRLEAVAGNDRWRLSRDFRALYGTSPYRYLTMRRLDQAKRLIEQGRSLSEAATEAGFADQSHMTRQFADAFGIPPGRWVNLRRAARDRAKRL